MAKSLSSAIKQSDAPKNNEKTKVELLLQEAKEKMEAEKNVLQNKIDKYNNDNPNNGCTFIIAHRPEGFIPGGWFGYYITVRTIKPVNGVISIPSICDEFCPSYINSMGNLKVIADEGYKLKTTSNIFGKIKVKNLDLSELNITCFPTLAGAFHGCQCDTINVSNWDLNTIKDKSLASVFRYVKTKELIGLDTWDTSVITKFTQVFYKATIQKLNISNWNITAALDNEVSKLFQGSILGNIDLTNWDVSNVLSFDYWFDASKIESIGDVSNWDISKAKNLKAMFRGARIKDNVDLSKWQIQDDCNIEEVITRASNTITA